MKNTLNKGLVIIILLSLSLGCSKKRSHDDSSAVPETTLAISGKAIASDATGFSAFTKAVRFDTNSCASAPWSLSYVGGGGAQIASGTANENGDFTTPAVPRGREGIVTFSGTGCNQRCLVKAGDSGVYCNIVADAVLGAFEAALSKSITDASFASVRIAKMSAAIQEAAEGEEAAVEAFNLEIQNCLSAADKPACFKAAVEASPFAGQFKMLQAAANGWTVESIFTYFADSAGFSIDIDQFIYTDFGTKLGDWLQTDFITKTKEFVAAVVADQAAGGSNTYAVKIACKAWYSKYHAGGQFSYEPVVENGVPNCKNTTAWTANGIDSSKHATISSAIDASGGGGTAIQLGTVSCDTQQGWDQAGYFCMWPPRMELVSKFKEPNRNDPSGERGGWEPEARSISLVNIFKELDQSMESLGSTNPPPEPDCMGPPQDGPPAIKNTAACNNWFGTFILANKKNFAGVLGLYMYLKNPSDYTAGGSALLSLDDIHKIFTGDKFLNARLTAWAPGYQGVQVSYGQNSRHMEPLLAYNATSDKFSMQDIFRWQSGQSTITSTQADTALALSTLPYSYTFKMFEVIPDSDEIRHYVFGSSHHEDWNPSGSQYFYAAGVKQTGKPVVCKMIHTDSSKAMESELSSKTSIVCQTDYTNITVGSSYLLAGSGLTGYPYVLQSRGWMGDTEGGLFVLADRKTGQPVRPGNMEIMIKEYRTDNASICKTEIEKNKIVEAKMKFGWGDDTREEAIKAYCLDINAYTNSGLFRFYDGGEVEIKQDDGNGHQWSFRMRQIGARSVTGDTTTLSPACMFSTDQDLAVNQQTNLVSAANGGAISGNVLTTTGSNTTFDFCDKSANYPGKNKYYLVMMSGSEGNLRTDIKAFVFKASDPARWIQAVDWGSVTNFEDTILSVKAALVESKMTDKKVSSDSAPIFASYIQLLNVKYDSKFDPYCDDVDGNGYCDCFAAASYDKTTKTGTRVTDPRQCSLLDFAAEPTISNPPYCLNCPGGSNIAALFEAMGGKAGADLATVPTIGAIPGGAFNGQYLQNNQMWFNTQESFQCQYLASGEVNYRKPQWVRWEDFSKNVPDCPNASGVIADIQNWGQGNESGGGPVRLIMPRPMNNAYDVARPNTLMKLIASATKTVGQNVTLAHDEKAFSFDEALALIAVRNHLPVKMQVYSSDESTVVNGAHVRFQEVETLDQHNDAASAVLRGLTRP